MSDSSLQDKWGDLARSLGAEVRDELEEQPAASSTSPAAPVAPSARRAPLEPRRPPSGWDQLIGEFGLPGETSTEPAQRPAVSPPPRVRSEEPSPPVRPRPEKKPEPSPRRQPPRPARAEGAQRAVPAPSPAAPPAAPPETRSGYGLPDWFPFARKREVAPPPPVHEAPPPPPPVDGMEAEVEEDEAFVDISREIGLEAEGESDVESLKGKRRRPRRRRRGGRGKAEPADVTEKRHAKPVTPVESVVVDLGPAGHEVELFDDDDEQDEEPPAEVDAEEGDELDEGDSGRQRSASHRNIPSWADAIGVVVDANLAMRTERKKISRPPGDSRGRVRGRRKKRP